MTKSRLAYDVSEAATVAALGRSTVYAAIRRGELTARKAGRRTVVLTADLEAWLKALPPIKTTPASGASADARPVRE
ncbi:MAG TPA: helix-turn-helix domain-containing protein [Pseudolabrys sp.]|nr:helix-turn-helix domain-containing protein [Pseudolabrys sp.]